VNLASTAPLWLVALLVICLGLAGIEDAVRLRISNLTCLAIVLAALIAMGLEGFPVELWQNLLVFVAVLALGTLAFAAEVLGGGDVKLLAALGLWMNFRGAVWLIAAVFLAGGILAVLYVVGRKFKRSKPKSRSERRIPYGIAIAAGALFVMAAQRPEVHRSAHRAPPSMKLGPLVT
jgi:prepilin peptidase CpaA